LDVIDSIVSALDRMPRAVRVLAALGLMALIFVLSAQPDLDTGPGTLGFVVRKLGHMAVYGLLFLLWLWALPGVRPRPAAAIAVLYAISDEYHQGQVEGRHGSPVDVLIDAAGVALAWAGWRRLRAQRGSRTTRGISRPRLRS
jgi:VanZ family protein